MTDTDDSNLKMYLEENYEITSERVIKAGVDIVSNENKYHPIRDYLEGLVWDGVPRIENLLPRFLGAEKNNYTTGVMKMHMLAAISRICLLYTSTKWQKLSSTELNHIVILVPSVT